MIGRRAFLGRGLLASVAAALVGAPKLVEAAKVPAPAPALPVAEVDVYVVKGSYVTARVYEIHGNERIDVSRQIKATKRNARLINRCKLGDNLRLLAYDLTPDGRHKLDGGRIAVKPYYCRVVEAEWDYEIRAKTNATLQKYVDEAARNLARDVDQMYRDFQFPPPILDNTILDINSGAHVPIRLSAWGEKPFAFTDSQIVELTKANLLPDPIFALHDPATGIKVKPGSWKIHEGWNCNLKVHAGEDVLIVPPGRPLESSIVRDVLRKHVNVVLTVNDEPIKQMKEALEDIAEKLSITLPAKCEWDPVSKKYVFTPPEAPKLTLLNVYGENPPGGSSGTIFDVKTRRGWKKV